MIHVDVKNDKNVISEIIIKGHSGYGKSGTDIVCASVSNIVITTINALVRFESKIEYEERDGFISIKILDYDRVVDVLIINMLDLLEQLESQYKQYIKINKEVSSC